MLTTELAPLFWNPTPMSQGDDKRLRKVSCASLHPLPGYGSVLNAHLVSQHELTVAGFNTTFGFLARGTFTFREMSWILIKVFFGSSYLGFVCAIPFSRKCTS